MLGNTVILGDSFSSFEGYLPEGNWTWYAPQSDHKNDVSRVEETWWYPLFDGKDNVLLRNESFSGTTVCNSVRPTQTIDTSFINRFDALVQNGFFKENKVDTLLIFGGTNDYWLNVPFGEIQFDNFTQEDLLSFFPACGYLASRVKEVLPKARICWMINPDFSESFTKSIIATAEHFGQEVLQFEPIEKMDGHPSIAGMQRIRETVKNYFGL